MNLNLKKYVTPFGVAVACGFVLSACGSDSGSSSIDLEDSFDIVLSKASYDYNSKDSTLKVTYPVCKVGTLGDLVWKKANEDSDSTAKFKAYLDRNTAVLQQKGADKPKQYDFDGGKFPTGFWSEALDKKGLKFQPGLVFEKGDALSSVVRYTGECYAQDFKANMFNKNASIAKTENALVKFYLMFQPDDKKEVKDEKEVLKNIRAVDCDRLTLYNDLVEIEVDELKESSGELTVSYEGDECSVNFAIRYASEKEDCNAAYSEFEKEKGKGAEGFNFADYGMNVEYDEYCIAQLILNLKRDKNIPLNLKKSASLKTESKTFAKGVASLILSGLK